MTMRPVIDNLDAANVATNRLEALIDLAADMQMGLEVSGSDARIEAVLAAALALASHLDAGIDALTIRTNSRQRGALDGLERISKLVSGLDPNRGIDLDVAEIKAEIATLRKEV